MEYKAVAEAGVIGKPDPVAMEVVKAFVALKSGFEPKEELRSELLGFARSWFGAVVAPKEIEFVPSVPKTVRQDPPAAAQSPRVRDAGGRYLDVGSHSLKGEEEIMSSVAQTSHGLPPGRIISRGFAAAHGAPAGAVCLFLLHVPLQVVSTIQRNVQAGAFAPGREPDMEQLVLSLVFAAISLPLGLAVFFAFPYLLGGMLGQVRDRIDSPSQRPGSFRSYGQQWYGRLLGSQGLFVLAVIAVMTPLMSLAAAFVIQEAWAEVPAPGRLERRLLLHPVMLPAMTVALLLVSAVGVVYWMANCVVAFEGEKTVAAWRRAFAFCRQNFPAVLALWLINLLAGLVMSPLAFLGQFGIVTDLWVLAALAVVHSALIGYWGLALAGMSTSLYLDRRAPVESFAPAALAAEGG